ncbi:hypothetical protein BpHYR1_022381 [Brachionus plicatilis]|uniref:Uncharacterized protein n=1 Tax=Brachionus plicatilis TaxID=10195 RepID=A0A3M7T3K8_BRAPC|nr:hypothetical protein BpHYR1_022381 [Brachionus plicatilis]
MKKKIVAQFPKKKNLYFIVNPKFPFKIHHLFKLLCCKILNVMPHQDLSYFIFLILGAASNA